MNKTLKLTVTLLGLFSLCGCVPHMSKQACMNTNWYQLGYNDAMNDQMPRNLKKDVHDCAKYKITVNQSGYAKGWKQGASDWCTSIRAHELGVSGKTFKNICPANKKRMFVAAWKRGLKSYCIADNGFALGVAGKPYAGFCASRQNTSFVRAYNRGHNYFVKKQTVTSQLNNVNAQIAQNQQLITQKQNEIDSTLYHMAHGFTKHKHTNHTGSTIALSIVIANDRDAISHARSAIGQLESQRANLQRQLAHVNAEISSVRY